jgi:conjugal transfer pilus assembly protein TraF
MRIMTLPTLILTVPILCQLNTPVLADNQKTLPKDAASLSNDIELEAASVEPRWTNRHAEGWFWRDVEPEMIEPESIEEKAIKPVLADPNTLYPPMDQPLLDPIATLEALQKAVESSKARAVLQPTDKNLMNYIQVQNELFRKNTLFADNWQRLVWRNPEYDYNQVRPSNPVALSAYSQSYKNDRRVALHEIAKEYGLYFVIAASCPYCHAMSPYLKRFAETYGFTVITVSTDGGSVPDFPDAMYSPEFAQQLGVKTTPAIILAKPNEGIIEPVSYGYISLKELEARIYRLFRLEPGQPNYRVSTTGYQP